MKMGLWLIVAAIVAVGAYMWYSGGQIAETGAPAPVSQTGTSLGQAASDAASDAATAVGDAATAATEAAQATGEAASEAATAVQDTANAAAQATGEAASDAMAGLGDLLTTTGFDYDKLVDAIDASETLGEAQKTGLKTSLDQARDNPALLQSALDQVKAALGL
jgi:hypothetical protein